MSGPPPSKKPIPAVQRYNFKEVNSRKVPNGFGHSSSSRTPSVRLASLSTDTRCVNERRIPINLPANHLNGPSTASSSSSPLPEPDIQPNFPQNDFGELSYGSFGASSFLDDDLPDAAENGLEMEVEEEQNDKTNSRRRYTSSDNTFHQLKEEAPEMLKEIMRREGRGGSRTCAGHCNGQKPSKYRCRDCEGHTQSMFCRECLIDRHRDQPYDKIEEWNGSFFEKTALRKLGMSIQLCHLAGEKCKFPRAAKSGFVVVDFDCIQTVDIFYCGCQDPATVGCPWQQLFRSQLFPAIVLTPHTAFTFRCIKLLHALTLHGKVTTYDFYRTIEDSTDIADIDDGPTLTRVLRMFWYLRMLKRGGIGSSMNPDLDNVTSGSLAVVCPACPRPEINLPENWLDIVKEKQFLFYKFISVDACFRLKRRTISNEAKDPGQITGKAYYVKQADYQEQMALMKNAPKEKIDPHCTGHGLAAIEQAYTKFQKGYSTTGCMLCLCARHEIVEPNGIADLDVGEKFWHTDWAISASQRHSDPSLTRILSYDICCQYHVHFFERLTQVPEHIRIEIHVGRWRFVVPKLHIKGHGRDCQEKFAFHLLPGAGQTDGEGIERQWASLGPIGSNTKEMGPGHRRDTIDDHVGFWGFLKILALGRLLRKRRADARQQTAIHDQFFQEFSDSQPGHSAEWLRMIEDWEAGRTELNPYSLSKKGTTEKDVRLAYATKEMEALAAGDPFLHDVSPSAFLVMGLDIEEEQRQLAQDLREQNFMTVDQQTDLLQRRSKIQRSISRFRALQKTYTPLALTNTQVISNTPPPAASTADVTPENTSLLLPSSLPEKLRVLPQMKPWVEIETAFRNAQLQSSLDSVRSQLFVQCRLSSQQSLHVRGQKGLAGAKRSEDRTKRKLADFKRKYQAAWLALLSLVGHRDRIGFRWLTDADVVPLNGPDTTAVKNPRKRKRSDKTPQHLILPGESRRNLSWIWSGVDVSDDSEAMKEAVRVEWCKAYSRKMRWREELELVEEEMRRTPISLEHEAGIWEARRVEEDGSALAEGINSFSSRQASFRRALIAKFQSLWALPDPSQRHRITALPAIPEESKSEEFEGGE
ncbi:hypothetical protein V5O48_010634 [Marasmius crinis-equi]|uniref:CxC2-like cysteine cluster KDZ transposase-associated domain-containing protein n=1 Tax=Marasmius crinis-equi TaxID=585013 RepID=A0ABR3F7V2_9AGAR